MEAPPATHWLPIRSYVEIVTSQPEASSRPTVPQMAPAGSVHERACATLGITCSRKGEPGSAAA